MEHPRTRSDSAVARNTFGPRRTRLIFREMVKAEIEVGILRGTKRRQLLRFARRLGISSTEAGLIIAEVQHGGSSLAAGGPLADAEMHRRLQRTRRSHGVLQRIMLASATALVLDMLLIHWLF